MCFVDAIMFKDSHLEMDWMFVESKLTVPKCIFIYLFIYCFFFLFFCFVEWKIEQEFSWNITSKCNLF